MAKKQTASKPIPVEVEETTYTSTDVDLRTVFIDSVVDGKLVKLEGYLTDTPINESSKVVGWQDDGENATNKFFTNK